MSGPTDIRQRFEDDDFSWFHPGPLHHANGTQAWDPATLCFLHDNGALAYAYATGLFHHRNGQLALGRDPRILHHNDGSPAFTMPQDHRGSCLCEGRAPDGSPMQYWAKRMRIALGSGFSLEVGWFDDLCDCITLRLGDTTVAELGSYMRV